MLLLLLLLLLACLLIWLSLETEENVADFVTEELVEDRLCFVLLMRDEVVPCRAKLWHLVS